MTLFPFSFNDCIKHVKVIQKGGKQSPFKYIPFLLTRQGTVTSIKVRSIIQTELKRGSTGNNLRVEEVQARRDNGQVGLWN